jgi:hypothetical protein
LVLSVPDFSLSTGLCTAVTYTVTNYDGTALNSGAFSFDSTLMKFTVSTSDTSFEGAHKFTVTGTTNGDTIS